MLRLAVKTTAAVLLIGPPGTGKGTLLKWLLGELGTDPEAFGFEVGFQPDPMWRTPDESWSAFELIGGLAPDHAGQLAWSRGALLHAIAADRWLVLDETNRGDMDKIMGPLLTWLSEQEVEVGTTLAHQGRAISIGWGDERVSVVNDQGPVDRYLAGSNFRLLGTYNPQDAQRVFRFGQALSRRFVVIPVPAVKPGQFAQILEGKFPSLPEDAAERLTGLYAAHFANDVTTLGPAVFLRMARYLLAGLPDTIDPPTDRDQATDDAVGSDADDHTAALAESGSDDSDQALPDGEAYETEAAQQSGLEATPLLDELVAEAYVTGVGRYLAGFEERVFQALGERIVIDEAALPPEQWTWVSSQRNVLS